jgi:hypothetical protein
MATYTSHYHLKKPEPTDTTEIIADLNSNYDLIDTNLHDKASTTHATTHVTGGTDVIANAVAGGNSGLMTGADKQNLNDVVAKKHEHTNKALLDTYTQTENNLADAVDKKHTQGTDTTLGNMSADINMNYHKITNVTDPTSAQDAATKNYVDTHATQGIALDQVVLGSQIFG